MLRWCNYGRLCVGVRSSLWAEVDVDVLQSVSNLAHSRMFSTRQILAGECESQSYSGS